MYMCIVWYKRLVLQFVCKIKGNSEPSHQHDFRVARLCVLRGHRISHVQLEFIVLLKRTCFIAKLEETVVLGQFILSCWSQTNLGLLCVQY